MFRMIEDWDPTEIFNGVSTSITQIASDLYSSIKTGLTYVKEHPAEAFTMSLMASARMRSHNHHSSALLSSQLPVAMLGTGLFCLNTGLEALPTTGQFPAVIPLSSLNGANGFELNGAAGDASGLSVSQAGDVNNDGIGDIIIGAPSAFSNVGKCYVVFGKTTWTSPFSLATLNGDNGFELNGVTGIDTTGYSVSHGDINNDRIQDIIIGVPNAISYAGKTYVVFGKSNWTSPVLLSTLNGNNGFELNGTPGYNQMGFSVSGAGDVNKDGIEDIIMGSPQQSGGPSDTGKAYVVFGNTSWTSPVSLSTLNLKTAVEI